MHFIPRPALLIAGLLTSPLQAGDYDQALSVLSKAFPKVRSVGVFYDGYGTVLNLLEFETSAYKEFGLSIKLVPLDPKERVTVESLRALCVRNGIHAILLLDGDPLVQPSSPAGRAVFGQVGRIPVAAIREEWLNPVGQDV